MQINETFYGEIGSIAHRSRILAAQSLMAPWLTWNPAVERQRPTLWERLDDDP